MWASTAPSAMIAMTALNPSTTAIIVRRWPSSFQLSVAVLREADAAAAQPFGGGAPGCGRPAGGRYRWRHRSPAVDVLGHFARLLAALHDAVVLVDEDDGRFVAAGVGVVEHAVGDDDDEVAGVHEVGGGPVDAQDARAPVAGDDVGGEPGAVGDVDDVDLLARQQVGGVHEVGVDGDGSHVVQIGRSDGGAVDLAHHHQSLQRSWRGHACSFVVGSTPGWASSGPARCSSSLSMSRVVPDQAATTSSAGPW